MGTPAISRAAATRAGVAAAPGADPPVDLDPALDRAMIAGVFARAGRVHVPHVLTREAADRTYHCLAGQTPWQLHLNEGAKHFDVIDRQLQRFTAAEQVLLLDRVHDNARAEFQCLYNSFPIHDAHRLGRHAASYLVRVYEFLNSALFLAFAREVTGLPRIELADAQATLFRPGHFLTVHDDREAGKGRLAAYVLSFTPHWQADWGGVLQFIGPDGHVAEGYTPAFNALNLFRVPQAHAVSFVAPFARGGRYSIAGWLRERR